jgi:enoyl-CoA hydratase/carnithine racemase
MASPPDDAPPRIEVGETAYESGVVARITVHNERKLNVVGRVLMTEFIGAVEAFSVRDDLRALVITGAGEKAFIGGANIPEMAALNRHSARDFIDLVHRTCNCLRQCPAPVIARIDGYALGAGLEIAAASDLRVATTRARFGMPEVKVGIPSVVEAALISRLIGFGRTRELLMLGEMIDAETALRWGLIERMVAPPALDREVETIINSLLAAGPHAVRIQKKLMQEWENLAVEPAIRAGIDAFARAFDTDEPSRMLSAFIKRKS